MAQLNGAVRAGTAALSCLLCAVPALAQNQPAQGSRSNIQAAKAAATDIATQPVRDVGIMKTRVPPLLLEAQKDPYSLDGLSNCEQLAAAINELSQVLGPDYVANPDPRHSRKIRVTGNTVAGFIVPFRGIVREVSGAAPAQRHLDAAIDAGLARRGFLRGVRTARKCRDT
jgi:hypothetical protein